MKETESCKREFDSSKTKITVNVIIPIFRMSGVEPWV